MIGVKHYHIRWSRLDWARFDSLEEAEAAAKQLVRQSETYAVEEYDEACPRCQETMRLKSSSVTQ